MTNLVLYRLTEIVSVSLYDLSRFVPVLDSQGKELCILHICAGVPVCVSVRGNLWNTLFLDH